MFPAPFHLRSMELEDIEEVMAIERYAYPFPWTEGNFRDCLNAGYFCQVLEERGAIIAYIVMSMAADEAHVLNICVHPDYQGQGLGRSLLRFMEDEAYRHRQSLLLLEVRSSNSIAISLYKSMGFDEVGRRKGYYPAQGGREDALVLMRKLDEEISLPEDV